jgi:hypothetical protein
MMVDAVDRDAELEDVTDVLLLTRSDDFNAVTAAELRSELGHGHVFRVAPDPEEPDLLPPSSEAGILGDPALTFAELSNRFAAGARIVLRTANGPSRLANVSTDVPLFAVASDGRLSVAADGSPPDVQASDTVIVLASPKLR